MQKVILITGTSTGLGINLAIDAAKAGNKVYATMRNLSKREALDAAAQSAGVSLEVLQLDVQDTSSVNAAVNTMVKTEGRIDVLINNAGAGIARTTEQISEEDAQWTMDVNFMGVVRCTKAVLPHMRAQRSGRVITISSVGGLVGQPFHEIYCAAKFAVEGYMESLATYVTASFGIHFTTVQPGGIKTEFANSVMKHIGETGGLLEDEYLPILQKYIATSQARSGDVYQTPEDVSKIVMTTMTSENPPIRTRTSEWSENLCSLKTDLDPDGKKMQAMVIESMLGAQTTD